MRYQPALKWKKKSDYWRIRTHVHAHRTSCLTCLSRSFSIISFIVLPFWNYIAAKGIFFSQFLVLPKQNYIGIQLYNGSCSSSSGGVSVPFSYQFDCHCEKSNNHKCFFSFAQQNFFFCKCKCKSGKATLAIRVYFQRNLGKFFGPNLMVWDDPDLSRQKLIRGLDLKL